MMKNELIQNLNQVLKKIGINYLTNDLHRPDNRDFGDYSTPVAMKLTKLVNKPPLIIAQQIVKQYPKDIRLEKIEVVKPGFINFWLAPTYLFQQLKQIAQGKFLFPHFHLGIDKRIMIEFAQPNTHKLFHIGHLRNISIGESLVRIFEATGNKVIRSNYQGDVGLHIAKCLWQVKKSADKIKSLKTLNDKIKFLGEAYAKGQQAYEDNEIAKQEILKINQQIYEQDQKIYKLWKETVGWSLEYFDQIYKRVDSHFDRFYFESDLAKRGIELCLQAEKQGILKRSQGALVFDGKPYKLHTRVFINSQGFPTYEGKELALAEKEFSDFGELDKCIHVVTPEQKSFFQVTFQVEELLNPKKFKDKQFHLAYEWVKLKSGKMSSRTGNIIEANWLIDKAKEIILKKFKCDRDTAETIAVAAVKYSFLKSSVYSQIAFDFDESINLEGNSAPYLLYTYVRTQSVINKSQIANRKSQIYVSNIKSNLIIAELNLLRTIYQFSEVVEKAARDMAPNHIANYLFELAQKFNLFYQKYPILKAEESTKKLRLLITKATSHTIKKGLYLLGINTVEKM